MRIVRANSADIVSLGKQGELNATQIVFYKNPEFDGWDITLSIKRNGDAAPYIITPSLTGDSRLRFDGERILWDVNDVDTAKVGPLEAELIYGNGVAGRAITKTFYFNIEQGLGAASDTVPNPYQSWYTDVVNISNDIAQKVKYVGSSATSAASSAQNAESYMTDTKKYMDSVPSEVTTKFNSLASAYDKKIDDIGTDLDNRFTEMSGALESKFTKWVERTNDGFTDFKTDAPIEWNTIISWFSSGAEIILYKKGVLYRASEVYAKRITFESLTDMGKLRIYQCWKDDTDIEIIFDVEDTTNKTSIINEENRNSTGQYPSVKAMMDKIEPIEAAIDKKANAFTPTVTYPKVVTFNVGEDVQVGDIIKFQGGEYTITQNSGRFDSYVTFEPTEIVVAAKHKRIEIDSGNNVIVESSKQLDLKDVYEVSKQIENRMVDKDNYFFRPTRTFPGHVTLSISNKDAVPGDDVAISNGSYIIKYTDGSAEVYGATEVRHITVNSRMKEIEITASDDVIVTSSVIYNLSDAYHALLKRIEALEKKLS